MNHDTYRSNQEQHPDTRDPRFQQGADYIQHPGHAESVNNPPQGSPYPHAQPRQKKRDPLPYIGLGLAVVFFLGNILFALFLYKDYKRMNLPEKSPLRSRPTISIREKETANISRVPETSPSRAQETNLESTAAPVPDENSLVIDEVTLSLPADWYREEMDTPESRSIYMYKSGISKNFLEGYGHLMIIENNTPADPEALEAMYDFYINEFQSAGTFSIYDERLALIDDVSARTMTVEGRMNQSILYGKAVLFCTSEHFVFLSFTHPSKENLYALEDILRSTVPFTMFGVSEEDLRSVNDRKPLP